MARHELVVVGASAGGVEALRTMIDGLDPELAAAVCVVQHVPAQASSLLPILLQRHPQLPASHAVDGEPIQPRHIYVAPPDHHLLVQGTVLRLGHGPRENNSRPAIDPLFRSAARWYGERCIGVVLSGMLDDGTAGLVSIKQAGGVTIAQDPADAQYPSMPRSAIEEAQVDHVASAHGIGRLVSKLVRERGSAKPEAQGDDARSEAEADVALAGSEDATPAEIAKGVPASFGCPECGGALWRLEDG
ncbi:MAG TPA: chemotaxis protein CheB, partial [Polyangiales bacterium]|nr:chemotaxis protein CheB [Polyangiales bacterium]